MAREVNFQQLVTELCTQSFSLYLRAKGWQQKASRSDDRFYFEGELDEGGDPYQIYLPSSPKVKRYRTLLQRAVYLLSDVEDREPREIAIDILTYKAEVRRKVPGSQLRVRNIASKPLQLRVTSRPGEHLLLPGESVELVCQTSVDEITEIEHSGDSLTIHDSGTPRE